MDSNREVDVASLLQSVAGVLQQNKSGLNNTDASDGRGTHGDRVAQAFQAAAQAAQRSGSNDAGEQFQVAAQALRRQGQGKSIQYYANGLEQAAQQFQGKQGLAPTDLLPLLQSLAGGAQQNNPMQPGQGSMLDALLPALGGFMNASNQGKSLQDAAIQALGGAVSGAQGTSTTGSGTNRIDPGAASATNVIGGIVGALLPGVLGALTGGLGSGGQASPQQRRSPQWSQGAPSDLDAPVGSSPPPTLGSDPDDPLGGLGGLLGGLLGGSPAGSAGQSPFGSLGGANEQGGQSPLGGLGGLLGGLLGGDNEPDTQTRRGSHDQEPPGSGDKPRYV